MKPHSSLIYPLHPSAKSADSAGSMAPQATNAPIQCRHCQGEHDRGYRSLGAEPSPASVEAWVLWRWESCTACRKAELEGCEKCGARYDFSDLVTKEFSHQSLLMEWIYLWIFFVGFPPASLYGLHRQYQEAQARGGSTGPCGRKPTSKRLWRAPVFMSAFSLHGCTGKKDPTKDEWDTFHKGGAGECSVNRWSPRLFACKTPCKAHEGPCKLLWIPLWILWEASKKKSWAVLQIDLQPLQNISSICPWFTKLKMVTFHCHVHLWEGRLVLLFLVPRLLQQFLAQPVRSGFELTPSEEFKTLVYEPNKPIFSQ